MSALFSLLASLVNIYSLVIWARLIMSWIPQQPRYNSYGQYTGSSDRPVYNFLCKVTDPFLNFFKRAKLTAGRIDFSPLMAFMTLNLLKSVFNILAQTGRITVALVLVLILQNLWTYLFSYILLAIVIMLIVRLFASNNPNSQIIGFLDPILNGPVCLVWRLFFKDKTPDEKKLVVVSLVFYMVIYFGAKFGISALVNALMNA